MKDSCNDDAICVKQDDNYVCKCKPGYEGDGKMCSDIDECEVGHNCDTLAECSNTIGSYICECDPGYEEQNKVPGPYVLISHQGEMDVRDILYS